MVYDQIPVIDVFRRIADDIAIGAIDLRHCTNPYFFARQRTDEPRTSLSRRPLRGSHPCDTKVASIVSFETVQHL